MAHFVSRKGIYTMKERCWLFKRRNVYYFEDSATGKQLSLGTKSDSEAQSLLEIERQLNQQSGVFD